MFYYICYSDHTSTLTHKFTPYYISLFNFYIHTQCSCSR